MVTKSYYGPGIDVPGNPGVPGVTATSVETVGGMRLR